MGEDLETAIKNKSYLNRLTESFISTAFTLAMIKDMYGGIVEILDEIKTTNGKLNEIMTKRLFEYCEIFRELPQETKIQTLINKNSIPIENIFQTEILCKKIKLHYRTVSQ